MSNWLMTVVGGTVATIVGGVAVFLLTEKFLKSPEPPAHHIDNSSNDLVRAAGADYSDLVESLKIRFEGFDPSSTSQFTGIPHLVFSFTNLAPKTAKISGSKGCDLIRWNYVRGGRRIHKTAMLNQTGSSIISVPAQTTTKISYSVDQLDAPAYGSQEKTNSVCRFWIGFGGSALLYEATALADSPIN